MGSKSHQTDPCLWSAQDRRVGQGGCAVFQYWCGDQDAVDLHYVSFLPFSFSWPNVRANKEAFNLQGQPKIYVKAAESVAKRSQAFCPECGTSIYSAAAGDPQIFNIRVGTARQRGELRPKSQGWCRSARDWVNDLQSMKRFDKQRTS
jgi:hypothetical protein